jgi:hypothetical protein
VELRVRHAEGGVAYARAGAAVVRDATASLGGFWRRPESPGPPGAARWDVEGTTQLWRSPYLIAGQTALRS